MNEIQNIDTLTVEILILKQQTAQNIIEIGKRLIAAKESLAHGEWGKYLEEKVDFSQRTANNFMKVASEFSNSQTLANLSQSKVFALLSLPQEEREEFVQANDVEAMSTRELQKVIKERDYALSKVEAAQRDCLVELENANRYKEEAKKNLDEKFKAESTLRTTDGVFRETQKKCDSLEKALHIEKEKSEERLANLNKIIAENRKLLSEAQVSGNDEEVERLQASLKESQNDLDSSAKKIDELEAQLKANATDVITAEPVIIEKVPEEVQKELEELRKKASQGGDQSVTSFKIYFVELQAIFKRELEVMAEIKVSDPEIYEKCKSNVLRLINSMTDRL